MHYWKEKYRSGNTKLACRSRIRWYPPDGFGSRGELGHVEFTRGTATPKSDCVWSRAVSSLHEYSTGIHLGFGLFRLFRRSLGMHGDRDSFVSIVRKGIYTSDGGLRENRTRGKLLRTPTWILHCISGLMKNSYIERLYRIDVWRCRSRWIILFSVTGRKIYIYVYTHLWQISLRLCDATDGLERPA